MSGNRRSQRQSPVYSGGSRQSASWSTRRGPRIVPKGDLRGSSGEGGIRTLEAGISPPNALAGRRLQPLGHFSGRAHRTRAFARRRPAGAGLRGTEGEGFEPSMHLSAHTRFPVALLRPLGHPSGSSARHPSQVAPRHEPPVSGIGKSRSRPTIILWRSQPTGDVSALPKQNGCSGAPGSGRGPEKPHGSPGAGSTTRCTRSSTPAPSACSALRPTTTRAALSPPRMRGATTIAGGSTGW